MSHSILAPSSAGRRVACPGSRALEERYPEIEESEEAKEGHAAHWVASQALRDGITTVTGIAPNGEIITQEMLVDMQLYVDEVRKTVKGYDNLHIEEQLPIASIHPACFGTPDAWYLDIEKNHIYLWDFKYGHAYVDVFENWQLIEYAAGIIEKLSNTGLQIDKITFCIVQPRCFHRDGPIRKWEIAIKDLIPYFIRLTKAEYAAMEPTANCTPTPQCKNCSARHACEALQHASLTALDESKKNTPWELNNTQLSFELKYLMQATERLNARITGLSEQALALIKRGESIPGFIAEQSQARERWAKSIEEIIALGEIFGTDLKKPASAITPKQAIDAGVPKEIVRQYSETPAGIIKLAQVKASTVRKIFKKD